MGRWLEDDGREVGPGSTERAPPLSLNQCLPAQSMKFSRHVKSLYGDSTRQELYYHNNPPPKLNLVISESTHFIISISLVTIKASCPNNKAAPLLASNFRTPFGSFGRSRWLSSLSTSKVTGTGTEAEAEGWWDLLWFVDLVNLFFRSGARRFPWT